MAKDPADYRRRMDEIMGMAKFDYKMLMAEASPKWGKPGRPKAEPKPSAQRLPMRPHHKGRRK